MKKKVLIVYNRIWNYRIPIFELLAKEFDLTVAHCDKTETREFDDFKTVFLDTRRIIAVNVHISNLFKIAQSFDVVIGLYGPKWLSIMLLLMRRDRRYKVLLWGIGVSASYTKRFDQHTYWDWIRFYFARKADAIILYSDYPVKKHIANGVRSEKIFVANNTVRVAETSTNPVNSKKATFIFVGTLYLQKGVNILLEAFKRLNLSDGKCPDLDIIGSGPEFSTIRSWIDTNDLSHKINLHGAIYDEALLAKYFENAIACISPNQAGLSVLTSMAHGVPFITSKNAITGGEIFNIQDGQNGFIFDGTSEGLYLIMNQLANDIECARKMGAKAKEHYYSSRRPEQTARSIIDAVNYTLGI